MENILISCNTLFQVYVAIILKENTFASDRVDMIFKVRNAQVISDNLLKCNLFDNVIVAKTECEHAISKQIKCAVLGCCDSIEQSLETKRYDKYITYNYSCFEKYIYSVISRVNQTIEVWSYDEGFSSYVRNNLIEIKHPGVNRVLDACFKLTGKSNLGQSSFLGSYLLEPQLSKIAWKNKRKIISDLSEETREMMNAIFSYEPNELYKTKKVIVLDQPSDNDRNSNDDICLIKEILDEFSENDVLIRLHPRGKNRYAGDAFAIDQSKLTPWEIVALNANLESQVLITVFSSACLTGTLLFGKPTTVLLLYHLLPAIVSKEDAQRYDSFYKSAAQLLNINIYIPTNMDELRKKIDEIKGGMKV